MIWRINMKHQFTIIVTILAGVFLILTPVLGSQENLSALDGGGSGTATIEQSSVSDSWIRTWGEPGSCLVKQVVTDQDGYIYVIGVFKETVDFDPGPEVDEHTSNGDLDFFLSKFDSSGNFIWTRTWGGSELEGRLRIALDGEGMVYLAGNFFGTIDFDQDTSVTSAVSSGESDVFLCKYDIDGNFKWVKTWGGDNYEICSGVAVDEQGQIFVAGLFGGNVDFDPGSGSTIASPEGEYCLAVSLSKFDLHGDFEWVRVWGGIEAPGEMCTDVIVDGNGDIYTVGAFTGSIDFDPGPEIDERTSNGEWDAFLTKFDRSGVFLWARTWGGHSYDLADRVVIDINGDIHVSGTCSTVDSTFDAPCVGEGINPPVSEDTKFPFLSLFDSSGSLLWAREWGGLGMSLSTDLAVDAAGNTYISESHQVIGGLDLQSGLFNIGENYASSVIKFDLSGNYQGYSIPGDVYGSDGLHLAVDNAGMLYVMGTVSENVNFYNQLFIEDHSGSDNPGVFLIKLPI